MSFALQTDKSSKSSKSRTHRILKLLIQADATHTVFSDGDNQERYFIFLVDGYVKYNFLNCQPKRIWQVANSLIATVTLVFSDVVNKDILL